jgi:hypothetical protein
VKEEAKRRLRIHQIILVLVGLSVVALITFYTWTLQSPWYILSLAFLAESCGFLAITIAQPRRKLNRAKSKDQSTTKPRSDKGAEEFPLKIVPE